MSWLNWFTGSPVITQVVEDRAPPTKYRRGEVPTNDAERAKAAQYEEEARYAEAQRRVYDKPMSSIPMNTAPIEHPQEYTDLMTRYGYIPASAPQTMHDYRAAMVRAGLTGGKTCANHALVRYLRG